MRWGVLGASALALSLGACVTVVRGTTSSASFDSEPQGAEVVTSAGFGCPATPCTVEVARKTEFVATFRI